MLGHYPSISQAKSEMDLRHKSNKLILWYKYLIHSSHDTEGTTSVLYISVKWRMDKWLFQSIKQGSLVWDVRLSQQCYLGFWSSEVWHYSNGWVATDTCGAFIFLSLKVKAPNLYKMWGTNSPYNTTSHPLNTWSLRVYWQESYSTNCKAPQP